MTNNDFAELLIIDAIKKLLCEQVNEYIADLQFLMPVIDFSGYQGKEIITPVIELKTCERTEKERILLNDAYSLNITFELPETRDSELHCYAYAAAVAKAINDNPTLGGVADRATVTGKKYHIPKKSNCG